MPSRRLRPPAARLGRPDSRQSASSGPYATFRNPFVYFQSLTGSPACARDDVGLSRAEGRPRERGEHAELSYIVPDRCHDGSPAVRARRPAGLVRGRLLPPRSYPRSSELGANKRTACS